MFKMYPMGKTSHFVSFSTFLLIIFMKLRHFDFTNHWNTSLFCDQWKSISHLNLSRENFIFLLLLFCLFAFNIVIKLRNMDFKDYCNTSILFEQWIWCQIWVCRLEFFYYPCAISCGVFGAGSGFHVGWRVVLLVGLGTGLSF